MIFQSSLPSGYTIFCDDIRHEVGGKLTLVGVYSGEMIYNGPAPGRAPVLAALVTLRVAPVHPELDVLLRITFESAVGERLLGESHFKMAEKTKADLAPLPLDAGTTNRFGSLRVPWQARNVKFESAGRVKVRAYIGDDEVHLGALRVGFAPQADEADTATG
ncbi:hypothetical protein ACCC88_14895 [Sphingomonas sp. Sphisp140]|uniref:DUF6941 family protein n=1 Tax=unclassified Sphingomonas TaxID=196159 RepID=UPI0039AFC613